VTNIIYFGDRSAELILTPLRILSLVLGKATSLTYFLLVRSLAVNKDNVHSLGAVSQPTKTPSSALNIMSCWRRHTPN